MAAWETISDPVKRRAYDQQWDRIKLHKSSQEQEEKRQAEAFKTEQKGAAKEETTQRKEQAASTEQLRNLNGHRSAYENQIFELNRVIRKLKSDLNHLREKDDEQLKKERERNSWWTYITSPIYGKPAEETEEQKQRQEVDRLQRLNSKRIKENDLARQEASVQSLKDKLQDTNSKIAAVKKKDEDAAQARAASKQERIRKEQEAKRREAEQEKRRAWENMLAELARRQREEAAASAAREAQEARQAEERRRRDHAAREAREAREEEERKRRDKAAQEAQEALQARRRERRAQAARATVNTARKNKSKSAKTDQSFTSNETICQHNAFWPKVQGSHLCGNCGSIQRHFALQCPGCKLMACASCRQKLRVERRRHKPRSSSSRGFEHDFDDAHSTYSFDFD